MKRLEPKAVISLGEEADKWCKKNNIKNWQVPAPLYWKNNHPMKMYPLIDLIYQYSKE